MPTKIQRSIFLILILIGLISGLFIGDSNWKPIQEGLPDAGPLVAYTQQLFKLAFTTIGILLFGKLIRITFLVKATDSRKALSQISALANLWAVVAIVTSVAQLAYVLGLNFNKAFSSGVISTYIFDLTSSRSYLISAVLALLVAVISLLARSENSLFLLVVIVGAGIITPLLNSHSATLGDHSLALTSSVIHGLAVSAWVGTLIAVSPLIKQGNQAVVKSFGRLAKWAVLSLVISGTAAAYTRLDSVSDFWTTGYGQLVVIKVSLFILIISLANTVRSRLNVGKSITKFLSIEITLLALAIGFGVALQNTSLVRQGIKFNSAAEEILGFVFPPAPTVKAYLFGWHPEWVLLTSSVIALAIYISAIFKLKHSQINWPISRTVSFMLGITLVVWASSSGISKYAMISFSAHMIQHMVLSMIAPIFLVLSAPITLALRALPAHSDSQLRNAREWILGLIHSSYSKLITHPIVVLIIFTFGLYGMYFTPLFPNLMRSHTGHVLMELHFLLSGFLFAFMTVGIDPAPRKIPHWGKLMMVLVALGLHTFFALAIMQSVTPVGLDWYSQVQPPWLFNLLKDTYTAGGIAWAVGEIPTLILALIVIYQWAKSDTRLATRTDRAAQRDGDNELKVYNERLARLNDLD